MGYWSVSSIVEHVSDDEISSCRWPTWALALDIDVHEVVHWTENFMFSCWWCWSRDILQVDLAVHWGDIASQAPCRKFCSLLFSSHHLDSHVDSVTSSKKEVDYITRFVFASLRVTLLGSMDHMNVECGLISVYFATVWRATLNWMKELKPMTATLENTQPVSNAPRALPILSQLDSCSRELKTDKKQATTSLNFGESSSKRSGTRLPHTEMFSELSQSSANSQSMPERSCLDADTENPPYN